MPEPTNKLILTVILAEEEEVIIPSIYLVVGEAMSATLILAPFPRPCKGEPVIEKVLEPVDSVWLVVLPTDIMTVGPVAPVAPVAPVGPVLPVAPVAPVAPVGP